VKLFVTVIVNDVGQTAGRTFKAIEVEAPWLAEASKKKKKYLYNLYASVLAELFETLARERLETEDRVEEDIAAVEAEQVEA
jgi:hypothetical protein